MSTWTTGQNKALGWFYFVVGIVTLVIAFIQQPISEWGTLGWILGAAALLLAITGLYQGITGRGNTRSKTMSEARQRRWAIIGLLAISVATIAYVASSFENWTAQTTLTIGVWVALLGLFISQIATLDKSK
ncbi:MAG TPA: hypothetical protein DCQ36_09315 [Actinobacteria bacterium]|jgi:hypothetical protein|nr:hypothetical protein [Actinomycetota bacterium]